MKAGVFEEVLPYYRTVGGDVSDVLHEGNECDGCDQHNRRHIKHWDREKTARKIPDRRYPGRCGNGGEIDQLFGEQTCRIGDQAENIAADQSEKYRNKPEKSFCKYRHDNDDGNDHKGDNPICRSVADGKRT
ncbi:hypothetical protein SDC9_187852 [bioreactor metagenome]|uniref:Uncharacterized protein n=1 Tax=bioreactor metagenome TaxID=1076179 RepID=A0A645HP12_9ZZZZ